MGPPAAAAALPDDLMEEILLRIPPSDPATLARAAVAQKRWCHLVASPGFRRRYGARHRAAPMLGFICDADGDGFSTFVPAASSSFRPKPRADRRHLRPEDARHGLVLLRGHYPNGRILIRAAHGLPDYRAITPAFRLVVWNPITRHRVALPRPKGFCDEWSWRATVLCAADPAGSCDHIDCHRRGHFIVVLIGRDNERGMLSCVYSSQDRAWSEIIFAPHVRAYFGLYRGRCSAHVGNALYSMVGWGWANKILKYDLGTREFSVMEPPIILLHDGFRSIGSDQIQLTTMEDGQLGLAALRQSTLYILSTDEEFGWGGTKIIDLKECGNYVPSTTTLLIGFAGDIGLVFMKAENSGILSVDIKSAQVKVVDKRSCISWIVPYINFCFSTPAMGVPSKDDKPRASASRDVQSCVANSLLRQGK